MSFCRKRADASASALFVEKSSAVWYADQEKAEVCRVYQHRKGEGTVTINEYQTLAMTTLNPALSRKDVLINSVMGLCGESGEAIDLVKKWLAQGHDLDRDRLVKELGDVAWYLAEAATALDVPLEDVLQANIDKLKKRYPEGFETERSRVRLEGDL